MSIKGTLIAAMAAGYFVAAAPIAAHAEGDKKEAPKGDKAGCKGKDGCKGKHAGKKEGEKKEEGGEKKEAEKPAK